MSALSFADVVGLGGVALGGTSTFVQFRRAWRVSVDGISLVTWYQFALMSLFWISYGTAVNSMIVVAGSAVCLPMQIFIVARLSPWARRRELGAATLFIFTCCGLSSWAFGWSIGVFGTGIAMVANRIPQIRELLRHDGDYGVSSISWAIGAACSLMWIVYYDGTRLWSPLIATAGAMAGNIVIASLAAWRHRQAESPTGSVWPLARRAEGLGEALQPQAQ